MADFAGQLKIGGRHLKHRPANSERQRQPVFSLVTQWKLTMAQWERRPDQSLTDDCELAFRVDSPNRSAGSFHLLV